MNNDLTIIVLTSNKLPDKWAAYHREVVTSAAQGADFISISNKPMDWGVNLIQDGYGINNLFKQILRGAKEAKTKYVATVEDDTLYSKEHFRIRPPEGKVGFDNAKWSLHTWGKPTYYLRQRTTNSMMIAERDMVVRILEDRFAKDPDSVRGEVGKHLREDVIFHLWAEVPNVQLHHKYGLDVAAQHKTKALSPIQAYDIPYWGTAESIVSKFV
jgi:hypothetical protein